MNLQRCTNLHLYSQLTIDEQIVCRIEKFFMWNELIPSQNTHFGRIAGERSVEVFRSVWLQQVSEQSEVEIAILLGVHVQVKPAEQALLVSVEQLVGDAQMPG